MQKRFTLNRGNSPKESATVIITSAQDALSFEQRGRQRRYFLSMMVRTGCFIASIFLPSPYRWIAMGGAVVLPYVAVVIANAGRENRNDSTAIIKNQQLKITET